MLTTSDDCIQVLSLDLVLSRVWSRVVLEFCLLSRVWSCLYHLVALIPPIVFCTTTPPPACRQRQNAKNQDRTL